MRTPFIVLIALSIVGCEAIEGLNRYREVAAGAAASDAGDPSNPSNDDAGSPSGDDDASTDQDALAADADASDAPSTDASADSGQADAPPVDSGRCTTVLTNDSFTTSAAKWLVNGSAQLFVGNVMLTDDQQQERGSIWFHEPDLAFDGFVASYTFRISGAGFPRADGFGFGWVQDGANPFVGSSGQGLGFYGLAGYAVAVITYDQESYDPRPPFIAVVDGKINSDGWPHRLARSDSLPAVLDGADHRITVVFKAAHVTVSLDGVVVIDRGPIVGYVPYAGYFGFFGATGADTETASVKDVSMQVGDGCSP